jgi:cytochrome c oxidase assembly protein subunit 15
MVATLLVGGATRLTESGLSIVEWRPLTGVLPPLNAAAWQAEFAKYQQIPQFRQLNTAMSLDEFKTIFWWEWGHRLLARTVGAAFLVPFLWFLWRGDVDGGLRNRLWAIFCLGAALGAVGWWMVSSGLTEGVRVSQYRLAFHLTLACGIFAAIMWVAQRLRHHPPAMASPRLRAGAGLIVILVLGQIYLGALVAGLRAGLLYNTWPLIDGAFVPGASALFFLEPLWRNFFENALTVQFTHRMVAYILWIAAILHAVDAARTERERPASVGAATLAGAVTIQAILGIVTVLRQAPLMLSLLHQTMAIVVLTIAIVHAERISARSVTAAMAARTALRSS